MSTQPWWKRFCSEYTIDDGQKTQKYYYMLKLQSGKVNYLVTLVVNQKTQNINLKSKLN